MNSRLLIGLFFVALLQQSLADLPVHCLKHHAVGRWKFSLDEPKLVKDPYDMTCGHEQPDNAANSYLAFKKEFKPSKTYTVNIQNDNSASESSLGHGTWTMIYDEAMDVEFGKHKFTAFFSYYPKESGQVVSYCGSTVVGWYLDQQSGKRACFKADKIVSDEEKDDLYVPPLVQMYVVQPEDTISFLQSPREAKFLQGSEKNTLSLLHKGFKDHESVIHHLNNNVKKSWTAKAHESYHGKSISELNQLAGRKKFSHGHQAGNYQRHSLKNEMIEKSDVGDLPKQFSWVKKLPSPRQQKDCGSCYVFATMAMLEARLRIKYDKTIVLSPQHVLDCSFHNQGCDGGYPFLVEKFANEFELVPESCSPYLGAKGKCSTCNTANLNEVYKVSNYRFVGGAYGKSNEKNMMEELMNNGPFVVSFEPAYDFMYYSGGVYHSVDADWIANGNRPEWERVDHSVLLYGWGETEEGEKYWEILNSWGTGWGENGSFRMKRGVDESAIESLAEAADPIIVRQ